MEDFTMIDLLEENAAGDYFRTSFCREHEVKE
jgi:hypothetical protein